MTIAALCKIDGTATIRRIECLQIHPSAMVRKFDKMALNEMSLENSEEA
jgi:hypothetical protein